MGILTMLFNRQILQGLGTDALAVYGVIVNVSTMVQCCAYSVGQAAQPILSASFGAGKWGRIRAALKLRADGRRLFQRGVDAARLSVSQRVHPHFHVPHRGHPAHRTRHSAHLRRFVPAAAAQYFLHLLFPVPDEAPRLVFCFGPARAGAQRRADLCAAGPALGPAPSGSPCPSPRPSPPWACAC